MEEENREASEGQEKETTQEVEEKLPYCTTAPSAEHARGWDEDEPCDDARAGDTEAES
jgi:hypothetical protein